MLDSSREKAKKDALASCESIGSASSHLAISRKDLAPFVRSPCNGCCGFTGPVPSTARDEDIKFSVFHYISISRYNATRFTNYFHFPWGADPESHGCGFSAFPSLPLPFSGAEDGPFRRRFSASAGPDRRSSRCQSSLFRRSITRSSRMPATASLEAISRDSTVPSG